MAVQGWPVDAGADPVERCAAQGCTEEFDRPGIRCRQTEKDADGRGFTGAVAAEKGVNASRTHGKIQVVEDDVVAERDAQVAT